MNAADRARSPAFKCVRYRQHFLISSTLVCIMLVVQQYAGESQESWPGAVEIQGISVLLTISTWGSVTVKHQPQCAVLMLTISSLD